MISLLIIHYAILKLYKKDTPTAELHKDIDLRDTQHFNLFKKTSHSDNLVFNGSNSCISESKKKL